MMLFKVDFEKAFDTVFYLASDLKINIHKSNIYGVGMSNEDVHLMASNTGCVAVDKFKAKLSGWKANLLSFSGRLTLAKSVLGSLCIYISSSSKSSQCNLGVRNSAHLNEMLVDISDLNIQADNDKCIWSMDDDGNFTVGALRRLIGDHLLPSLDSMTTWDKSLPQIPEISCPSCNGMVESNQHIFNVTLPKIFGGSFAYGVITVSFLSSPTLIGLTSGVRGPALEKRSAVCLSLSRLVFGSLGGS
ncbi:hypothetical protein Tco_1244464 [Tanacetum coccineum]